MDSKELEQYFQDEAGLVRLEACCCFLEPPADDVVRAAIKEIRGLRGRVNELESTITAAARAGR